MEEYTELEHVNMFQQVFSGKNGEVVLKWMKKRYGDVSSFVSDNPHGTSFNEGQRSVYLQIQQFMDVDIKVMEEKQKRLEETEEDV